ncbi:hypothetical protein NL676_005658 [Syzygium grande]|nr:hypothetical protein NL676_005658 [Syzygium grande]
MTSGQPGEITGSPARGQVWGPTPLGQIRFPPPAPSLPPSRPTPRGRCEGRGRKGIAYVRSHAPYGAYGRGKRCERQETTAFHTPRALDSILSLDGQSPFHY